MYLYISSQASRVSLQLTMMVMHGVDPHCTGPQFWDQDFLAFTRLDRYPIVLVYIPRLGLNDAFMVLGGVVLAFNIITR